MGDDTADKKFDTQVCGIDFELAEPTQKLVRNGGPVVISLL